MLEGTGGIVGDLIFFDVRLVITCIWMDWLVVCGCVNLVAGCPVSGRVGRFTVDRGTHYVVLRIFSFTANSC